MGYGQVDDLGFGDVGWRADLQRSRNDGSGGASGAGGVSGVHRRGDGVGTPTLDALRAEGVTLRHFYTPKDCAPSRASAMTGRYTHTHVRTHD